MNPALKSSVLTGRVPTEWERRLATAASDLRGVIEAIRDRPEGWHLWVITGDRYTALRPATTCDRCKAKARAFFGGSAIRGERFVITGPDTKPYIWADPELGHPLRFVWRNFPNVESLR